MAIAAIGLALLTTSSAYAEGEQVGLPIAGGIEEIVVTASKREEGPMEVAQYIGTASRYHSWRLRTKLWA